MSEEILIVDYKLVDYCSVDILGWKLVLIPFFYYLSHFCEMTRYCRGVVIDDKVIVANHILQKVSVIWQIFQKRSEFFTVSFIFQIFASFVYKMLNLIICHLS